MRVADIMTREVFSVSPDTTVEEILRLWEKTRVSGFPVVENGKVIGVVSEGDLIIRDKPLKPPAFLYFLDATLMMSSEQQIFEDLRRTVGAQARALMTSPAETISPEAEVSEAAERMAAQGVNRLPVVDGEGRLVGIVSRSDLVKALVPKGSR